MGITSCGYNPSCCAPLNICSPFAPSLPWHFQSTFDTIQGYRATGAQTAMAVQEGMKASTFLHRREHLQSPLPKEEYPESMKTCWVERSSSCDLAEAT